MNEYGNRVKQARATADANSAYALSLEGRLEKVLASIELESKKQHVFQITMPFLDKDVIDILKLHFDVKPVYERGVIPLTAYNHVISWRKE